MEIPSWVTLISSAVDLITGRVIGMPTDDPLSLSTSAPPPGSLTSHRLSGTP